MALLTDQFVGRAEQLGAFDQVLGEVDQGVAAAIVLIGEPRVGKTRFLAEFARSADGERAARPCRLGGVGARTRPPVLRLRGRARRVPARARYRSPGRVWTENVRTELSHVFPSLSALGTASGGAFQHERYRSHRAVRALLEELAKTRSLVLVLDECPLGRPGLRRAFWARCFGGPPTRASSSSLAVRPHRMAERLFCRN